MWCCRTTNSRDWLAFINYTTLKMSCTNRMINWIGKLIDDEQALIIPNMRCISWVCVTLTAKQQTGICEKQFRLIHSQYEREKKVSDSTFIHWQKEILHILTWSEKKTSKLKIFISLCCFNKLCLTIFFFVHSAIHICLPVIQWNGMQLYYTFRLNIRRLLRSY